MCKMGRPGNKAREKCLTDCLSQFCQHAQVEYAREGLEGLDITYKDNRPVLDLFLTRPIGLLSLLDEQCRGFNVRKPILQREESGWFESDH